jgi:hypothetical protein
MSCDSSMHIVSHLPYSCISLELFPSGAINESWLNTYGHLLLKANGSGLLNILLLGNPHVPKDTQAQIFI